MPGPRAIELDSGTPAFPLCLHSRRCKKHGNSGNSNALTLSLVTRQEKVSFSAVAVGCKDSKDSGNNNAEA